MRNKLVLVIAMAALLPLAALAQSNGYYERSYTRMSFVQGDVYVQRAQNQGFEQGQVNLVVVEGDKLGTKSGRLEVQLGLGNYLRLDQGGQVEVAGLPDAEGQPTKFHVLVGSAFVRVAAMDAAKNFEIHTPDASFYVLREGLYRVDVRGGETEFSVFEGAAEGAGQSGSIVIEEGQRAVAADGSFMGEPTALLARRDDFSAWNDTRDALFASRTSVSTSYLPAEYADYESELSAYGSWVDEADYGYVWVPQGLDADWRPYSHGRWVWYPIIGWTWVSYDPWGWSPYHYGRWGWRVGLGWYWIPRHHMGWSWGYGWGPAWVDWWWDGDYYGWCPLSYWNRPAYIWNNTFYGRWDRSYYRDRRGFGRTMTAIRHDQMHARNVRDVAVGFDRLAGRIDNIDFRGSQPGFERAGRVDGVLNARAGEAFSGRGARTVERGYAGDGTRLSAGEIRSSSTRGRDAVSGAGSRTVREGGAIRSGGAGQPATGRIRQGDANSSIRSGSADRGGADRSSARNIRSYPSSGSSSGRVSSGSVRTGRDSASRASGSSMREYPSSSSGRSTSAPSTSRSSSSYSNRSTSAPSSTRSSAGRSSSGTLNRSTAREYPSSSSARSYSAPSTSRSSSSYSNRSYAAPSSTRSSAGRSSSGALSRSTTREYPSSSSARSYSAPSTSRSTSSYSNRSTSAPSTSRSSSSSNRSYSAPSRSYSSPSTSRSSSSYSNRSYSAPSRSYSAPSSSRSSSSYSNRSTSAPSSSRSYSAPSRSSSSSSRSYSAPSRSSSGGGSSRSSSGSSRSSSGGSRRR